MPQVKIHVSNNIESLIKGKIAMEVSETMSRYADINDGILQVMVYESKDRISNDNKTNNFVLIEVLTSKERTRKEKQWLANLLINKIEELTFINSDDITVIYDDVQEVKYFGIAKKISEKFTGQEEIADKEINYQENIIESTKKDRIEELPLVKEMETSTEILEEKAEEIKVEQIEEENIEDTKDLEIIEEAVDSTLNYIDDKIITNDINSKIDNVAKIDNVTVEEKSDYQDKDNSNQENKEFKTYRDMSTFELIHHSEKGVFNLTKTKILKFK